MTDYLSLLNALDENERLEAKRGSEIGPSILETICAFANEPGLQGGTLLLGVVRDESDLFSPYVVEGVAQPDALSADLATQCREQFNVPVRAQISSEQISGRTVLVVTVPEAQPGDKPVFIKSRGLPKGAFRRLGSTDQQCTEDDLLALYQGRQVESYDYTVLSDTSLTDFSPEAIADYRKVRAEANADAEELRWSDEDLLESLGCARRHGDVLVSTVAGLLLFGKPQALRRVFPMTRVDYIRVPGKEWVPDPERRFDSLEIRDYLFRAFVARYYFQHFLSEEAIQWLSRFRELHLTDEEARALVAVREQGAIDNAMYRELNRVDTLGASQSLRRLRDAGLLEQKGRGSGTYYQPTPRLLGTDEGTPALSSNPGGLTSNPGGLTSNPAPLSSNPLALSSNPGDPSNNSHLAGLPENLRELVSSLGLRAPPARMQEAIIALCHHRPWQAVELAALLNRTPDYIATQHLRPLVNAGVLVYTRPEVPNHPHQAYRAVDAAGETA